MCAHFLVQRICGSRVPACLAPGTEASSALHQIVIIRLRHDERTGAYVERRTQEGMGKMEAIRCLERIVAREVFKILRKLGQQSVSEAA